MRRFWQATFATSFLALAVILTGCADPKPTTPDGQTPGGNVRPRPGETGKGGKKTPPRLDE